MKKIVFTFILAFLLFVQSPLYTEYNISELESHFYKECATVDIKDAGDITDAEQLSKAISDFSDIYNASVFSLSYESLSDGSDLTEIYTAGYNIPESLKQGKIPEEILSDFYESNSPQEINVNLFNPSNKCIVKRFSEMTDKHLARQYFVYPKSVEKEFRDYLIQGHNVEFYTSAELNYIHNDYVDQLPGVSLMMAALLVFFAFWIIHQYQLNAVKKLHGYSDLNIVFNLFANFVGMSVTAIGTAFLLQFIFCGFYNHWVSYANIVYDSVVLFVPIFAILITLGLVFSFLFYSSDVKYALKGKRPFTILNVCAAILKVITIVFLFTSVITIGTGLSQANETVRQVNHFERVGSYRIPQIQLATGSSEYLDEFDTKAAQLYKSLDGVLINDRNIMNSRDDTSGNPVLDNTLFVNPQYFQINPLYDESNKPVVIDESEIADNELIVLIPESYKTKEDKIHDAFVQWYKNARYISCSYQEIPKDQRVVEVNIEYIKDGQESFAFNTDILNMKYNHISDAFIAIVSSDNMDKSFYSANLINGRFLIEDSAKQSKENIIKAIDDTKISEEITGIPTVLSTVDTLLKESKTNLIMSSMFLIVIICMSLLISIYIVKTYMEQNKKVFFIKKMLGYPVYKIFGKFISVFSMLQLILLLVIKASLSIDLKLWGCISGIFMLVDITTMWLTSWVYQKTLTKDVLKGEK